MAPESTVTAQAPPGNRLRGPEPVKGNEDALALTLYEEACKAEGYRILLGLATPFDGHPEPIWRDHFTAKYGADWYDTYRPLIEIGEGLAREQRAEARTAASTPAPDKTYSRLGSHLLSEISMAPPPPLLIDRLDPESHTILFGTGGVGKGTTASWWIIQLVRADHRVLVIDYEDHPGEWSRRIDGLDTFAEGIRDKVRHVAPLSNTWQGVKGAIWDQAHELRTLAVEFGATYIVIDSIVPACGGADVGSGATDSVASYGMALQEIGLPALSLAHVKKDGGLTYPFGSVFWHNLARVTWSIEKDSDGDRMIIKNKKANNYGRQSNISMEVTWRDGKPRDVTEQLQSVVMADRIHDLLDEPMTVNEIVARLNEDADGTTGATPKDTVQATLRRGLKSTKNRPKRFSLQDEKWSRAE